MSIEIQMNASSDRQHALDSLTSMETTAKMLINAFVKKNNDAELSLHGIHREELVSQTSTFLTQAQKLILNLANTLNLTIDGLRDEKKNINEQSIAIKDENGIVPTKQFSLSSATLDDIIDHRLTPKHLISPYPLFHDPIQPNLVALARTVRQMENVDDVILKMYSKIFNHEERICCNYDGIQGKLPYPRHKRLLFDQMLKLTLNERQKSFNSHECHRLYTHCEKHFSNDTSLTNYRGPHLDQLNQLNDEEQFICALFRLIIPQEDIKKILAAKQESNDNQFSINHARPIHLLWMKQKWLERYPVTENNEAQRWSQCIDWALQSLLETPKIRPSKRKTMDVSTDHKRSKSSLTLEEKIHQIDRTKFDVIAYAREVLRLISETNKKTLPTFEQLQCLEQRTFRYYWTKSSEQTWSTILDLIPEIFQNDLQRQIYRQHLLESNPHEEKEIERLLPITNSD